MVCIYCQHQTNVINSRHNKRSNAVWRRRRCANCAATFTTFEKPDLSTSLMVRTKRGNLSPFSRDKLFITVYQSCGHRKTALADADGLTATVIGQLMSHGDAVIDSHTIQTVTHAVLKNFDAAAAVSYAAYHRS